MNICILSIRYPYKDNMVHVFVKKLVDEWAKFGHRCVVISPVSRTKILLGKEANMPYYEKQEVGLGCHVEIYRPRYYDFPSLSISGVTLTRYSHQKAIEATIIKTGLTFDVIYGHFFSIAVEGWQYAKKNNIPLFVATGESVITIPQKPCSNFSIAQFKDDLCGCIAVSSKNMFEAAEKGLTHLDRTKVFPNGANIELFGRIDKQKCRQELGLPNDAFILICVGQFIERKGQKRILQALNKISDCNIKTIFIGKGSDEFEHSSILFKGTVANSELPYYLNASDVFVLPTRNEGCCNAIIEALACGLPIVSSDLPFNYDVLNKENSILVNPNDIDQIARAIRDLYYDAELRKKLAEGAIIQGGKLSIVGRSANIMDFIKQKIAARV